MQIRFSVPDGNFTAVPNDILVCPLSAGEKITWLQLASACRNGKFEHHGRGIAAVASELGLDYSRLSKAVMRLKASGGLIEEDGDMVLVIPGERVVPEPKKPKQITMAEEVAELPRAKPTGISEKDSWQVMRQAWDREKPEQWVSMGGHSSMVFIAISTQAKRLGIERADYPDFVAKVCRGASADDWWSSRNLKPSNVFGMSAQIEDKKFQNVEKLYKSGQTAKRKFSTKDDKSWLAWYAEKAPALGYSKVERLHFATDEECWAHEREHREGDTIYLYTSDDNNGFLTHWTRRTDLSHRVFNNLPL